PGHGIDCDSRRTSSLTALFGAKHIIGYEKIENVAPLWSVVATGRGVGVNVALRLGLRGERRPVEIHLTLLAQRERAIVVDHLRRHAPNASFSSNLHSLWTGAF